MLIHFFFNHIFLYRLFYLFLIHLLSVRSDLALRPRGVPLEKKAFYDPTRDFTCFDGSSSIPFHFVNDDYCDCLDGSDEPGTSACLNGIFHCPNLGFVEKNIPSSNVNDGICDCCDGSDEYNSTARCVDNCEELGLEALKEAKRLEELVGNGSKIREKYIEDAKQIRRDFENKLEELKVQIEALESVKNEKKMIQDEALAKEKQALEKFKKIEEEKKKLIEEEEMQKSEEEERKSAMLAFKELDLDQNGILTYLELMKNTNFDQDENGVVEEQEAKFFLHMKNEMALEEFISIGWVIMKPFFLKDKEVSKEEIEKDKHFIKEDVVDNVDVENVKRAEKLAEEAKLKEEEVSLKNKQLNELEFKADEETTEYENEEAEETEEDEGASEEVEKSEDEAPATFTDETPLKNTQEATPQQDDVKIEYDEETKHVIEEAKKARKEFNEIESQYSDLVKKSREVEHLLSIDLGSEGEFHVLHGGCYEYTDNDYTYKFCPFVKASQRPKEGGSETILGQWGHWSGELDKKYERQKYLKGLTCWNGPERSVDVLLRCGLDNKLSMVKEPSRCEYLFEFETPALCKKIDTNQEDYNHEHLEL